MEHPLIGPLDDLSTDDLTAQITDLNRKLSIAMQSGNGHMCNQIRMALESYQNKYQEKLQTEYARRLDGAKLDSKIDIK